MDDSQGGLVVVVPTYNELENIDTLVGKVEGVRGDGPLDLLFVDDGSPDGTADRIRALAATRPWIHILERSGRMGLGSAYRAGFAWARTNGFERVGEMDADLSHDPAYLTALDAAIAAGADLALGSRYATGGGSEGWPLQRRLLSKGANLFARTLLRLRTRDVTGGFRIYSGPRDRSAAGRGHRVRWLRLPSGGRGCADTSRSAHHGGADHLPGSRVWQLQDVEQDRLGGDASLRLPRVHQIGFAQRAVGTRERGHRVGCRDGGGSDRWPLTYRLHR